jgi:hypothetical protein
MFSVHSLPYEIILLIIRLLLIQIGAFEWSFFCERLRISHVCFRWRVIVLDNVGFWSHLQVYADLPLSCLHACLFRSKQAAVVARLHLISEKRFINISTGRHVNGSSSVGVLRTFRPFLFKLEVLCVLFRGRRVLEEMRDMFDVEHFDRLRSLNLDCKPYLPRDPHRIVADTVLAFPLHMCGLTTLRLRGVDV